jgi:hypothetical protein
MTLSPTAKAFFRCEDEPEPRWFDRIEPTANPWRDWFSMLQFPQHGPLDSWIERYIDTPGSATAPAARRKKCLRGSGMECPPSLSTFPGTIDHIQQPPEYPLLAQSGHQTIARQCPLLGVPRMVGDIAGIFAFSRFLPPSLPPRRIACPLPAAPPPGRSRLDSRGVVPNNHACRCRAYSRARQHYRAASHYKLSDVRGQV